MGNPKKKRMSYINFMSGFAMIMIILVHSPQALPGINEKIIKFTSYGQMGCQCFFLLTGFKLCLSYYENKDISLWKFYFKRWLSIAPLYYLAIFVGWLFTKMYSCPNFPEIFVGCWRQNTNPKAIISNVLLIHNLFVNGNNDVVGGGWYIGVTFLFYLLFPLFIWMFDFVHARFKSFTMMLPFLFAIFLIFVKNALITFGLHEFINCDYMSFFEQSPCILLGMSLYYQYADGELDIKKHGKILFLIILLIGLTLFNIINFQVRWVNIQLLFTILYYFLFVLLHQIYDHFKPNWIAVRISNIGKVSYALLFVHVFIFYEIVPVIYRILPFSCNVNVFWLLSFVLLLVPMYYISWILTRMNSRLKRVALTQSWMK